MAMKRAVVAGLGLGWLAITGALLGCDPASAPPPTESEPPADPAPDPGEAPAAHPSCTAIPACDDSIHVDASGSALLITDPQVLARVPLKRVMEQLVASSGVSYGPAEAVQRLFDTMNSAEYGKFSDVRHCDASPRAPAFASGDSLACPRAEGALAFSDGLFEDGHPDSFLPVAIVNRFDLTPINATRCGQYRIIYAKRSGLTDPKDRVFLIFEPALANPNTCLEACRPVAKSWHALEGASPAEIADFVDAFFFEGLHGFAPVFHPSSFGADRGDTIGYGGGFEDGDEGGQIRLGMQMDSTWTWRELRYAESTFTGEHDFLPATVKNNPAVALFSQEDAQSAAWKLIADDNLAPLSAADAASIEFFVLRALNGAESRLAGPEKNDYFTAATRRGDTTFLDLIDDSLQKEGLGAACPPGDPLDAEAILDRATTQSCAGCHAPSQLIGPDRSIGCGLTWPDTLGEVHVNEKSEISPALKDVFLPHRAKVLETYLQACDLDAMFDNFQSGLPPNGFKVLPRARTLGGSATH